MVVADLSDASACLAMMRQWVLVAGMLVGAALAVFYIARVPGRSATPTGVAAWVDDRPVSLESYQAALDAVAGDRKDGVLAEGDRARVLDRLIDQELLIGRAIELGLHERDPQIRNQLATAMIDFLVRQSENETGEVSEAELRDFYEAERFRFEQDPQYRIAVEGAAIPVPRGFVLEKEIAQRLGPSVAEAVADLDVGESTEVPTSGGQVEVALVERRGGGPVPFEQAREVIEAAYRRSRSERAVRDFLDEARRRSEIRIEVDR